MSRPVYARRKKLLPALAERIAQLLSFVCLIAIPHSSSAQEGRTIELQLGDTPLMIDRNLIKTVSGHSLKDIGSLSRMVIPPSGAIVLEMPRAIQDAFHPPCGTTSVVVLQNQLMLRRSENSVLNKLSPRPTKYLEISKLEDAGGYAPIELYQFDASDLRDHWNDQISFWRTSPSSRVRAQVNQDFSFDFAAGEDECFFEFSPKLVREFMKFMTDIQRRPTDTSSIRKP
jgi:hypothetical protein